jgi:hypothetical protein
MIRDGTDARRVCQCLGARNKAVVPYICGPSLHVGAQSAHAEILNDTPHIRIPPNLPVLHTDCASSVPLSTPQKSDLGTEEDLRTPSSPVNLCRPMR